MSRLSPGSRSLMRTVRGRSDHVVVIGAGLAGRVRDGCLDHRGAGTAGGVRPDWRGTGFDDAARCFTVHDAHDDGVTMRASSRHTARPADYLP